MEIPNEILGLKSELPYMPKDPLYGAELLDFWVVLDRANAKFCRSRPWIRRAVRQLQRIIIREYTREVGPLLKSASVVLARVNGEEAPHVG